MIHGSDDMIDWLLIGRFIGSDYFFCSTTKTGWIDAGDASSHLQFNGILPVTCNSGTWKISQVVGSTTEIPSMTGWWLGHPSEKYERQLG